MRIRKPAYADAERENAELGEQKGEARQNPQGFVRLVIGRVLSVHRHANQTSEGTMDRHGSLGRKTNLTGSPFENLLTSLCTNLPVSVPKNIISKNHVFSP